MLEFEDIQEEVLTELFGTTGFTSTLRGLFGRTVEPNPKRAVERKITRANKIQQASGFLSDKSLNDVDIPTFLRQAMTKSEGASKGEKSALRSTGYQAGPPGADNYGKVGGAVDTVSAATMADAAKRRAVYAGKSYASIRETLDQTIRRLLNEMRMEEWRVTPQLNNDPAYARKALGRAADAFDAERKAGVNPRKARALKTARSFLGYVSDAHFAKDDAMRDARDSASWATEEDNEDYPNSPTIKNSSVEEGYVYDEALINKIVEELLEAFEYDQKYHKGALAGNKYDTLQRALDAGNQLTPEGQPMGDYNHIIVSPEEPSAKKVVAPQPPAEAAPEGDVQDRLDPMKRIQPIAAPVK